MFITMEYFPHGDLRKYMTVSPPFPEAEAQQVTFQLVEGLGFLHENGFTHRDLKPSVSLSLAPLFQKKLD